MLKIIITTYNKVGDEKMNDELMHFGTKGMRWGFRHQPVRIGKHPKSIGISKQVTQGSSHKQLNDKDIFRSRAKKRAIRAAVGLALEVAYYPRLFESTLKSIAKRNIGKALAVGSVATALNAFSVYNTIGSAADMAQYRLAKQQKGKKKK